MRGRKPRNVIDRFWEKVRKTNYCWIWKGTIANNGYGQFFISWVNRKQNYNSAHRFAYQIQNGSIPEGFLVCHKCDNKLCVNGEHLFVGTHQDNENDKQSKGRGAYGSKHPNAKLTEKQVLDIRAERLLGISLNKLAKKFNVSKKLILVIVQRKWWKHI